MTKDELKALKVGDRVRWVSPGGSADGEVVERLKGGYFRIRWYDKQTEVLNPRSGHDRTRAKNIMVVRDGGAEEKTP